MLAQHGFGSMSHAALAWMLLALALSLWATARMKPVPAHA
jgi:hypothetical protein